MHKVGVGLIGLGTVGYGVARVLHLHGRGFAEELGLDISVVRASARSMKDLEAVGIEASRFTIDWRDVIADPEVDIVVELIGGTTTAREIVEAAIAAGKDVVTANKALMATHGNDLLAQAVEAGVEIRLEASVGGGIPIIAPLQDSLPANEVQTIAGIVNGTTNYILTTMEDEGSSFDEVLADAQEKGYAEAEPSADVDGFDAAAKIAILASIGFHTQVGIEDVFTAGIRDISITDIEYAEQMGYRIKLLAIARRTPTGVDVRVHPTMIPIDHQLASISGVFNAIYVIGDVVGETMFVGPGAGELPTASAVTADIIAIARKSAGTGGGSVLAPQERVIPIRDIENLTTRYYVRMFVEDRTGVLAATADAFARHDVSIESMVQRSAADDTAELVYVTHRALEKDMRDALKDINALDPVERVATLIRVEDTENWKAGIR